MPSSDIMMQLGVGGILTVMILRQVFDFLQHRKNGKADTQIREMHEWLSVRGPRGEKLIYGPPGLGDDVKRLGDRIEANTEAVRDQTRLMDRVLEEQKATRGETAELNKALSNFLNINRR